MSCILYLCDCGGVPANKIEGFKNNNREMDGVGVRFARHVLGDSSDQTGAGVSAGLLLLIQLNVFTGIRSQNPHKLGNLIQNTNTVQTLEIYFSQFIEDLRCLCKSFGV